MNLPQKKLQHTLSLVQECKGKKVCRKRDLKSHLGHFQHVAIVIRFRLTFVHKLIQLLSAFHRDYWIRLNNMTYSDLCWLACYMEGWNRILLMPSRATFSVTLASGFWRCGAF